MQKSHSKSSVKLRVIDFFCGAGGFSEGFRQQGFEIIMGIDKWQPAIDTHNLNHRLKDSIKDILRFWNNDSSNVSEIEALPDSEFIIGSPSCISFSMANNAGKADKTLGLKLIETYLRIIAVKKYKKNSILKGWLMENVPKSKEFMKKEYSFEDLNLALWAKNNNKSPESIAIIIQGEILNAGDYGAPQERKRFVVGEWVKTGEFLFPKKTHENHTKSSEVRSKMPKPNLNKLSQSWTDPHYPNLILKTKEITDHFYDTGLYEIEWEKAEYLKTNHPFMGKMSFPENEDRTCRTIIATRSGITREPIIYKSEYNRTGNGEYRLPTIREIASLMGFPYVYQFVGSEGTKWRQIGNAVCPHMSAALAKTFRSKLGLEEIKVKNIDFDSLKENYNKINNLNSFKEKKFDTPKKRKKNALFRRHPLKSGNMTVDLMNYHPIQKKDVAENWYVSTFFGTGDDHAIKILEKTDLINIENLLKNNFSKFNLFKEEIMGHITCKTKLQKAYEEDLLLNDRNNPLKIVKGLANTIQAYVNKNELVTIDGFFPKNNIPLCQLMAMYGLLTLIYSNLIPTTYE